MSYRATILADSPLAYWRLGEASGTTAADEQGASPGTYTGGVTLGQPGALTRDTNLAALFDGVDDVVTVPDSATLSPTAAVSVEAWVYQTARSSGVGGDTLSGVVTKNIGGTTSTNPPYNLQIDGFGKPTFGCNSLVDTFHQANAPAAISLSAWHHLVGTYDGANQRLYVDGVQVAVTPGVFAIDDTTGELRIGRQKTFAAAERFFHGSIDEVAIYNYALTATQVAAHYAARVLYDYATFLVSPDPDFVVLAEIQPMEVLGPWTAAGGGLTNTYFCTFSQYAATSVVVGGLYRRLDEVRQNNVALTVRASSALVDANLGSYYFDTAASRLYVSTATGASPETFALLGAWFSLLVSTDHVSFSDQPQYLPLITGALPTLTAEKPDLLFGSTIADQGELGLLNGDGLFDRLSKSWVWRNKRVTFKLGGASLAYSDFATISTMRINAIRVDDEVATLTVESMGGILNRTLPGRTWGDGTITGTVSEEGASGLSQPILFGLVNDCPLTLGNRVAGQYQVVQEFQAGFIQMSAVYAINRSTSVRTPLANGVDFVAGSFGFTLFIIGAYPPETYEIRADLYNAFIYDGSVDNATVGSCARNLLLWCGESPANINTAAFATADAYTPVQLGKFLHEPTPAADLLRELEQSALAQVYLGADGRWTIRLFDPSLPAQYTLSDADFVTWQPRDDLAAVLNEVRVQYGFNPATGDASEASSSEDAIRYGSETSDSHTLPTWIQHAGDASRLAQHLRFLKSAVPTLIEFEERGLTLMGAQPGDLIAVTRDRGPIARTGRLDGQLFLLQRIEKVLGPEVPIVRGVLNDLDGQADRIARYTDGSTPLDWSTATDAQRAVYGFYADGNGYLDATDGLTRHGKVAY